MQALVRSSERLPKLDPTMTGDERMRLLPRPSVRDHKTSLLSGNGAGLDISIFLVSSWIEANLLLSKSHMPIATHEHHWCWLP